MWISRNEYNALQANAANKDKLEDRNRELLTAIEALQDAIATEHKQYYNASTELYDIKKDLEYYLNTNEENGVVYIPKFVVKKIVYGT